MNFTAVATATGTLIIAPVLGLVVLVGGGSATAASPAPLCASSGPVAGLDPEQAANARTIAAVTEQVIAPHDPSAVGPATVIALMTAYQESSLRNLANPNVPGSDQQPAASGSGSNLDSVGLFQQRDSWGSVVQRMDPAWATRAFLTRLLAVPGWGSLPFAAAAQAVQGSAFPDAYAQWQTDAQSWLSAIDAPSTVADTSEDGCGGSGLPAAGSTNLPAGFVLPPDTTTAAAQAITFALAQLGKPYVFDAAGPASFDCSGLTMAAWAAGGITLPHNAAAQAQLGTAVAAPSLLRPGDLVFIPGSDGTMAAPGHVGMFLGDGLIIEAPQTGELVKLVGLDTFTPVAAMRHYG